MLFWKFELYPKNLSIYYKKSDYLFKNILVYRWWRLSFSGFYADEIFGRLVEWYFRILCLIPAIFILDKWISKIMGVAGIREVLRWISSRLYWQRLDVFSLINLFVLGYLIIIISSGIFSLFWYYVI